MQNMLANTSDCMERLYGEHAAMHTKQCCLDMEDDGTIVKLEIGVMHRIRCRCVEAATRTYHIPEVILLFPIGRVQHRYGYGIGIWHTVAYHVPVPQYHGYFTGIYHNINIIVLKLFSHN